MNPIQSLPSSIWSLSCPHHFQVKALWGFECVRKIIFSSLNKMHTVAAQWGWNDNFCPGLALFGGLLCTGVEYYSRYTNTKREKEEKLQMIERRLSNILSNFHHHSSAYSNPQNRFTLVKTVDESKGYGFFGSPKGHAIFVSCSMCQSCISSAFPLEEGTLGLINEHRIRSEMESHVYSCDLVDRWNLLFICFRCVC